MKLKIYLLSVLILFTIEVYTQSISLPRLSQPAVIKQTLGLSFVEIKYSRPSVKGRQIWGGLVPYGAVWRAGANENTTIEFSQEAIINGKKIPAGNYGFHIIPEKEKWILIFSKHNSAWGSFFYDESYDQLRIEVVPNPSDFSELLTFSFYPISESELIVALEWEKISVEFTVKFDVVQITLQNIREQLTGLAGFGWVGPMQAAEFCLTHSTNYEEALKWINISISREENFSNLSVKYRLLKRIDNVNSEFDFDSIVEKFPNASAYQKSSFLKLLNDEKDFENLIAVCEKSIERKDITWDIYFYFAEAIINKGNKQEAKEYYKKALEIVPQNQNEIILKKIESIN